MDGCEVLFYADGDIEVIGKPPMLDRDGRFISRIIRAIQQQLHARIAQESAVNPACKFWDTSWQPEEFGQVCYAIARPYYLKIASLLSPVVDCDRLEPMSRHLFFVCTEPVLIGDQKMFGLSRLESLMGYELIAKPTVTEDVEGDEFDAEVEEDDIPTTGDLDLDTLGVALLAFKSQAIRLATVFNTYDLRKLTSYTSELLKRSRESLEDKEKGDSIRPKVATKPLKESPLDPDFEQNQEAIFKVLEASGIQLPPMESA